MHHVLGVLHGVGEFLLVVLGRHLGVKLLGGYIGVHVLAHELLLLPVLHLQHLHLRVRVAAVVHLRSHLHFGVQGRDHASEVRMSLALLRVVHHLGFVEVRWHLTASCTAAKLLTLLINHEHSVPFLGLHGATGLFYARVAGMRRQQRVGLLTLADFCALQRV